MWKLKMLSAEKEKKYKKLILDRIAEIEKNTKNKSTIPDNWKYLMGLERLLLAYPQDLEREQTSSELEALFSGNDYIHKKSRKKGLAREKERAKKKFEEVEKYFDYTRIISQDKETSYELAEIIGVNACIYCNRQYTLTVGKDTHACRPDFDHYWPQSRYPYFALSLYNLIPSCNICNSKCKGEEIFPGKLNPYLNGNKKEDFFTFSYIPNGHGYPEKVVAVDLAPQYENEVRKVLKHLKLEEIYSGHTNLELKEMYEFAAKYSPTYLNELLGEISTYFKFSQEEAYKMLFGTEMLAKNDNNRPLSKLKRDILRELGVID